MSNTLNTTYTTPTYNTNGSTSASVGIPYTYGTGTGVWSTSNTSTYTFTNPNVDNSLSVRGNAIVNGTLTVNGVDIVDMMQKISDRLCILVPDPKLLEQYEALRESYEHYKTLEALLYKSN